MFYSRNYDYRAYRNKHRNYCNRAVFCTEAVLRINIFLFFEKLLRPPFINKKVIIYTIFP